MYLNNYSKNTFKRLLIINKYNIINNGSDWN